VLALVGPTASGKTAAALALAEHHPIEIISVDSALVYRGMDIGTAKPTAAEQAQVVHHLIDIRDPAQSYSAADFVRDAQRLGNRLAPHRLGHLVQQEEQHHAVMAGIGKLHVRGVLLQDADLALVAELGVHVLDLHRRHVDHVQMPLRPQPAHQVLGEIAIDASHLQHAAIDVVAHFLQGEVAQARKIAPQDQVDQPLALEDVYRARMEISPPVGGLQVLRYRGVGQCRQAVGLGDNGSISGTHKSTLSNTKK